MIRPSPDLNKVTLSKPVSLLDQGMENFLGVRKNQTVLSLVFSFSEYVLYITILTQYVVKLNDLRYL